MTPIFTRIIKDGFPVPGRDWCYDLLLVPRQIQRDEYIVIPNWGDDPRQMYWCGGGFPDVTATRPIALSGWPNKGFIYLMTMPKQPGDHDFTFPYEVKVGLGN